MTLKPIQSITLVAYSEYYNWQVLLISCGNDHYPRYLGWVLT